MFMPEESSFKFLYENNFSVMIISEDFCNPFSIELDMILSDINKKCKNTEKHLYSILIYWCMYIYMHIKK